MLSMSDQIIDQVVNAAVEQQIQEEKTKAKPALQENKDAPDENEQLEVDGSAEDSDNNTSDETTDEGEKKEDGKKREPFPKKAVEVIDRLHKRISKLTARSYEAQSRLQKYEELAKRFSVNIDDPNTYEEQSSEPTEDKYDSYSDYIKDLNKYQIEQAINKIRPQSQPNQAQYSPQQVQQIMQDKQREAFVANKTQEYSKSIPDFSETLQINRDFIEDLSPQIERAILSCEDPALATYVLARQGQLEAVAKADPFYAAQAAARAVMQGKRLLASQNKQSAAPTPINGARGTAPSRKTIHDMKGDELLKFIES